MSYFTFTSVSLCAMGFASCRTIVLPVTDTPLAVARASVSSLPPAGVAFTVKALVTGTDDSFKSLLKVIVRMMPSGATAGTLFPSSTGARLSASTLSTASSVKPSASWPARSLIGLLVGLE